jgi:hypothetical protein
MRRLLIGVGASLFAIAPAMAQSETDARLDALLQLLAAKQPQAQQAAVVKRSAKIRFRVEVEGVSTLSQQPSHTPRCEFTFSHGTGAGLFYTESKTVEIARPGVGSSVFCDQTIPFTWNFADTTQVVRLQVVVRASHDQTDEFARTRFASHSLPPIPLPNEGQTVMVTDHVDF